jgi:hypothetical protein
MTESTSGLLLSPRDKENDRLAATKTGRQIKPLVGGELKLLSDPVI